MFLTTALPLTSTSTSVFLLLGNNNSIVGVIVLFLLPAVCTFHCEPNIIPHSSQEVWDLIEMSRGSTHRHTQIHAWIIAAHYICRWWRVEPRALPVHFIQTAQWSHIRPIKNWACGGKKAIQSIGSQLVNDLSFFVSEFLIKQREESVQTVHRTHTQEETSSESQ